MTPLDASVILCIAIALGVLWELWNRIEKRFFPKKQAYFIAYAIINIEDRFVIKDGFTLMNAKVPMNEELLLAIQWKIVKDGNYDLETTTVQIKSISYLPGS